MGFNAMKRHGTDAAACAMLENHHGLILRDGLNFVELF